MEYTGKWPVYYAWLLVAFYESIEKYVSKIYSVKFYMQ
jgi:hypothetical protein